MTPLLHMRAVLVETGLEPLPLERRRTGLALTSSKHRPFSIPISLTALEVVVKCGQRVARRHSRLG
jgi:hypothetical protein